jgi:hypothetical protein
MDTPITVALGSGLAFDRRTFKCGSKLRALSAASSRSAKAMSLRE